MLDNRQSSFSKSYNTMINHKRNLSSYPKENLKFVYPDLKSSRDQLNKEKAASPLVPERPHDYELVVDDFRLKQEKLRKIIDS